MTRFKVKEEFIGATVYTEALGQITIQANHGDMLAAEGKTEFLVGVTPAKKLKPITELKKDELVEMTKDLEGFDSKMTKNELIDLLNGDT